jgi:hypothetical protein
VWDQEEESKLIRKYNLWISRIELKLENYVEQTTILSKTFGNKKG